MKNITRQSWDMVPMPDKVIERVNILGKYQPDLLVFTDGKGRIIVGGDVDLTGVEGDENENQAPLKIENENDLDYQEDQEEFLPKQE